MWNPYEREESAKKRWYSYYAIGLFCIAGIPPSLGEVLHSWRSRRNASLFPRHFSLVAGMLSSAAKVFNLWRRRLDLEITADLLNWERRQPCNREFAIYRDEIITSTIRAAKLFSWAFILMVVWYCGFSYAKILIYSKGDMDKLSISSLWSSGPDEFTSYWLYFIIDKTITNYLAGSTVCHDIFFTVFLIHVGAQLDLLKERLKSCQPKKHRARARGSDVNKFTTIERFDDINDPKVETVCRSILEELSLNPIEELHTCIRHHQTILRCVNLIQNIFNNTLLLQFGTSLLIITTIGFRIFGDREISRNEFVDSVNFMMCALFQLFLYCWFGTEIISKSESVGSSGYSSKWYEADARFKQSLSIFIQHGQIPIVFRAGHICELSSQTFINIISKCYSCMAVLNQVNE